MFFLEINVFNNLNIFYLKVKKTINIDLALKAAPWDDINFRF